MGAQTDIIKFEGHSIYASGYGFSPKFVMQDTELSIAAKAVYLYFCSLTGGSYSVYPTRAQILNDLGIGKDKYYAALKNLKDQNYIHISKEKTAANKFEHNIYHLNLNPKKYVIDDKSSDDTIVVEGLLSGGSGLLSYRVMKSRAISHTEKAIYGYIVSFMGAGNVCMPKRNEILKHLGISRMTYQRAVSHLIALDLIRYSHVRDSLGRVSGARYTIILNPSTWQNVMVVREENTSKEVVETAKESQIEGTQTGPWNQTKDTQTEPWNQTKDTQTGPWYQIKDTQTGPWYQTKDAQTGPWYQTKDTQKQSMAPNQGHYHNTNTSSIYQTTTTKSLNEILIQKIIGNTSEDVVEIFEDYLKFSSNKLCLSDLEMMVVEYISELFIYNQGVKSRGLDRSYEYLESKTVKAIEENNFAKTISRIVDSYEQSENPISYPQGWVQSVYARIIGSKWDITPGKNKKTKKQLNSFNNFSQRDTDYDALVLEQMKNSILNVKIS